MTKELPSVDARLEILREYVEVMMGGLATLTALRLHDDEVLVLSQQARDEAYRFLEGLLKNIVEDASLEDHSP